MRNKLGLGGINAQFEYTGFVMVELQHDWRVLSALRYGAVYTPSAGLSELNAGVNLNDQITPRVSVSTGVNAISLQGAARNSPLVTKPDSLMGTVSIGYSF